MTEEGIIDRIRKLLALQKGTHSVEEAATAAAIAQQLMTKHRIEEAMLAATPAAAARTVEQPIHDLFQPTDAKKLAAWALRLGVVVSDVNDCKLYVHHGNELRIIGRPSDAQTARYFYAYLLSEIDRLCEKGVREKCEAELISAALVDKTWRNNFRLGAVSVLSTRLREAKAKARAEMRKEAAAADTLGTGTALVRVDNALAVLEANTAKIEAMGRAIGLKPRKASQARYDGSGREAGQRAGASINLSSGRPMAAGARGALKG